MTDPHLTRVSTRIAQAIRDFLSQRGTGRTFHADELREHVAQRVGPTAPGSADRILRDLRQKMLIDYVVVSRRDSLYRVTSAGRMTQGGLFGEV